MRVAFHGGHANPEFPARHSDLPCVRRCGASPVAHRERSRSDPRAARKRLTDAAFEDAHAEAPRAALDQRIVWHDELDIGARRRSRVKLRGAREIDAGKFIGSGEGDNNMRIADIHPDSGPGDIEMASTDEDLGLVDPEYAEIHFEAALMHRYGLDSGTGAHEHRPCLGIRPAHRGEIAHEDTDAVTAHLRGRPVGVPVVHEPLHAGGGRRSALGDRRGTDDPQQPVGADPEPSVAQRRHLVVGEVELPVGVGHDDKVVARAVALGERDRGRHAFSLEARFRIPGRNHRATDPAPAWHRHEIRTSAHRRTAGTTTPGAGRTGA